MRGMYRGQTLHTCEIERGIDRGWTLHACGRNVKGADIESERKDRGQTLQLKGKYRGLTLCVREMYMEQIANCKIEITLMDIT